MLTLMLIVLLLGVIHDYQMSLAGRTRFLQPKQCEELEQQQRFYSKWIRECVEDFAPDLIFDEMNLPEDAGEARLNDTGVLWVYMDIPEDVRKRFKLSVARRPGAEWVEEIDEPRERHWQLVIESISTACDVKRIAVVCGLAHMIPFGARLRAAGHSVETKSVRDQPWNDEGWATTTDC
jgi:hypothetical protein